MYVCMYVHMYRTVRPRKKRRARLCFVGESGSEMWEKAVCVRIFAFVYYVLYVCMYVQDINA